MLTLTQGKNREFSRKGVPVEMVTAEGKKTIKLSFTATVLPVEEYSQTVDDCMENGLGDKGLVEALFPKVDAPDVDMETVDGDPLTDLAERRALLLSQPEVVRELVQIYLRTMGGGKKRRQAGN